MNEVNIGEEIEYYCHSNDIKFMGDYSGRAMYGRQYVGLICKPEDKYNIISGLTSYLKGMDIELSSEEFREDNMGFDIIIYFP